MSKFRRVWSIEEERKQAEEFALRAMHCEEMGQDSLAKAFRNLVELCDKKIALYGAISNSDFVQLVRQVHAEKLRERNSESK